MPRNHLNQTFTIRPAFAGLSITLRLWGVSAFVPRGDFHKMLFSRWSCSFAAIAALCLMPGLQAAAQPVSPLDGATIVDVPFVLGEVDQAETTDMLWAKGDKPANTLLARFTVRPVQAAMLRTGLGGTTPLLLWRAFTGGDITRLQSNELHLDGGPLYFCGVVGERSAPFCLIDADGDGRFEKVADGMAERGRKPYHVTMIRAAEPLPVPQPYTLVGDGERPTIRMELRNCAKDYDYPRYVAASLEDRNVPVYASGFAWHDKDSSFAFCRRGVRLDASAQTSAPTGGYVSQIGPFTYTVGPKAVPRLQMVGSAAASALYRLEGATLVDMRVGHTPKQAQLLAAKAFPYPSLMADAGGSLRAGTLASGDVLASIPFHHAYKGRLTQEVTIATLFGKRSLRAGTVVYGFPARSQLTRTINGMPQGHAVDEDEMRNYALQLTWCAPVQEAAPAKPVKTKPGTIGREGWSAACIPHSQMGTYTIINQLQPAFGVSAVRYDATTSSNDGPPPIERQDDLAFAQPLRSDFVYEGREGEMIAFSQRIYFGDTLTSVEPVKVYAAGAMVAAKLGGARVELTPQLDGTVKAVVTAPLAPGGEVSLDWDKAAMMRAQAAKMGWTIVENPDEN